jgi:hypothetical protein
MPTGDQLIQDLLSPFITSMDKEGLTIRYLAKKLKSELNAHKTDTFKAKTNRKEMKTEVLETDNGPINLEPVEVMIETEEILYSKPMVDWKTRQQARKDALAYRGIIAAEKTKIEHSGEINYSNMTDEELDTKIKEGFNQVYGPKP